VFLTAYAPFQRILANTGLVFARRSGPKDRRLRIQLFRSCKAVSFNTLKSGKKNFAEVACIMGGVCQTLALTSPSFRYRLLQCRVASKQASYFGLGVALFQSASVFVAAIRVIWGPLVDELRRWGSVVSR